MLTTSHLDQLVSHSLATRIEQGSRVTPVTEPLPHDGILTAGVIRSPKRRGHAAESRANWFSYYAGFSVGFVEDITSHLNLSEDSILLDLWLGAGTTAEVAASKGFQLRGFDLNPAMLIVARARTVPTSMADQIPILTKCISRSYERCLTSSSKLARQENDPLEQWLQPASAAAFRILEQLLEPSVIKREPSSVTPFWRRAGQTQPLLALFYVALFRSLRHFISEFQTSNPTWIKVSTGGERIQLSSQRILRRFRREIESLHSAIKLETKVMPPIGVRASVIKEASSLQLPIASNSVDATVSSPAYCTRIDYVRATLPELAVIGYPNGDVMRLLREQMMGTPTINPPQANNEITWGPTCASFLSAVKDHSSKASATYYLKYYRQYFASAFGSLREIDRVLKKSGRCVLVVQDSFYKEVHNDLPQIFVEIATGLGWSLKRKIDFQVKQTLAGVNPEVKSYRTSFQATESVLLFSK
jgi:hypothetical protein